MKKVFKPGDKIHLANTVIRDMAAKIGANATVRNPAYYATGTLSVRWAKDDVRRNGQNDGDYQPCMFSLGWTGVDILQVTREMVGR